MSLLDRIADCAVFHPERYVAFRVAGAVVGHTERSFAAALAETPDVFRLDGGELVLAERLETPAARTEAVAGVLAGLRDRGLVPGWRDERYLVSDRFNGPEFLSVERAAVPLLGTRGYGVHVNGFVRTADGVSMWVGRRALTKPTGPGKLDQIVAGGQPVGISVFDNLVKECGEEAAIPPDLAATARPVGAVSYRTERPDGLRNDLEYVYDLELPADFRPENTDGEVDGFFLWPLDEVAGRLAAGDEFKFNSGLVAVDFLVRHGYLTPDDPDYAAIVRGLRTG